MAKVCRGDTVRIHYRGSLEDGSVFDESDQGEPLEFVAGSEEVIDGISEGVLDMQAGEKKRIVVEPDRAYGPRSDELEQWIPLADLPDDVEVGDRFEAVEDDEPIELWVREMTDEEALLDANHPLAGLTLVFDVELVSIGSPE